MHNAQVIMHSLRIFPGAQEQRSGRGEGGGGSAPRDGVGGVLLPASATQQRKDFAVVWGWWGRK